MRYRHLLLAIFLSGCGSDALREVPSQPHQLAPETVGELATDVFEISDTTIHSYGDTVYPDTEHLAVGIANGADFYDPSLASARIHRALVRLDEIPDGVVTGWRLKIWQVSALGEGLADIHRLSDVNEWNESGADWTHSNHAIEAPWGGSRRGLGAIGRDFDSVSEPTRPTIAYSPATNGLHTITLPAIWLEEWRDGVRANNGMVIRGRYDAGEDLAVFYSSDSDEHPLTFEVDIAP